MKKSFRILIVEDNPADREVIELRLAGDKTVEFVPKHAGLLSEAMEIVKTRIDAVLLDLSLPDSDGTNACEAIRSRCPEIPIVVLTGLDDEQMAIEALQCGAQDYLVKGQIDSNLLGRSLRYAIERQRIESALQKAHDELELRVEQRTTELEAANLELQREMVDRERAEEIAKARQAELAHLSRLNTLGELATNLAHELNQPLTAIVGYTRSCLRRLRSERFDSDEVIRELEKAASEAKRGGEIIKRLRNLVSKRDSERIATHINEVVRSVAEIVSYGLGENKDKLRLELDQTIPIVQADRVQIEQVIINLVQNAFELTSGDRSTVGEVVVKTTLGLPGFVEIHVIDYGPAPTESDLAKLFDAFYTTKENGLGLGLSISRSIIESHLGKLALETNHQGGLTAKISLPTENIDNTGGIKKATSLHE